MTVAFWSPVSTSLSWARMLSRSCDVQAAERLVEQEAARIADDGSADGRALLLALRELVGAAVEDPVEVQQRARPRHALGDARRREPVGVEGYARFSRTVSVGYSA